MDTGYLDADLNECQSLWPKLVPTYDAGTVEAGARRETLRRCLRESGKLPKSIKAAERFYKSAAGVFFSRASPSRAA